MDELVSILLEKGGMLGVVVAALVYTLRQRESELASIRKELSQVQSDRLKDVRQFTEELLAVATRTHEALDVVAKHLDKYRE